MKYLFLLIFSALSLNAFSQEKIYLDSAWKKVDSPEKAVYYRILEYNKKDNNKGKIIDYYISGKIQSEADYSDFSKKIKHGKFIMYYENGNIEKKMEYVNGKKNGKYVAYWENGTLQEETDYIHGDIDGKDKSYFENGNIKQSTSYTKYNRNGEHLVYRKTGQLKRIDNYENGKFTRGKCFDLAGNDTTYFDYEIAADFPGGRSEMMKFLASEMKYPVNAFKNKIEGKVYLRFIVDTDGSVRDVKITRGINQELDAEAIRAVRNMPKWSPGMIDGVGVKSYFDLPVNFKL
jgi:TonB family protein